MLDGYVWYVFQVRDEEGKYYAFAERIPRNYDLTGYAKQAESMNACKSKKEAEAIAKDWNEQHIKNGTANKWLMPMEATA